MSRMGIASFLAGFGTGYMNSKEREAERERQAKLDQIALDRADREKQAFEQAKAERNAIADAAADRSAVQGSQVMDAAGNKGFAASPTDAAWLQQQAQQEAQLAGNAAAPAGGGAVAQTAGQIASAYGVMSPQSGQITTQAPDLQALNSQQAKIDRVSSAMMRYDPRAALQLQQQNVQTQAAQNQLDLAKKSEKEKEAYRQMVSTVATGTSGEIEEAMNKGYNDGRTYKIQGDDRSGWIVSAFDTDGKPLGNQAFKSRMDLASTALARFDPSKWIDLQQQQQRDEKADQRWNKEFEQRGAFHADDVGLQRQRIGMEGASLGLRRDEIQLSRQAAQQKADAAVALYQEQHPNATPAQLSAVRTGVMAAIPGADTNAPAQVKLAKAMVESGLAPNMQVALQRAMQSGERSPDAIKADLYKAALSNPLTASNPEAAVTKAMQFLSPSNSQPGAAPGAAPGAGGRMPLSQFKPGQIYTDANGNRAQLVNGVLVPVK